MEDLLYAGDEEVIESFKDVIEKIEEKEQERFARWAVGRIKGEKIKQVLINFIITRKLDRCAGAVALLLKDKDSATRGYAAMALGQLQAKEYAKEIAALLKDEDPYTRGDAVRVLGNLHAKEIALLLKDENSSTRSSAAWALGELQAKEYTKEIAKLLNDKAITNFYNPQTKKFEETTVDQIAANVLKSWSIDPKTKD